MSLAAGRGAALALAIIVLALVGMLVAGLVLPGIEEARVGESARRLERSFGVVEEGVFEVIRGWDPATYNVRGVYPFDSAAVPGGYPALWTGARHATGAYGGYVYKLNGELYFIDITGRDALNLPARPGGEARRRLGLLAHVRPVHMDVPAALVSGRSVELAGPVTIDGNDRVPPGWPACGPADTARAGVRTGRGAAVSISAPARVVGSTVVTIDSTLGDSAWSRFGDVTYADLAAHANIRLPGQTFGNSIGPAAVKGRCDEAVATNWGDGENPDEACGGYVPIVHITGDASVGAGQGQGTLLIDGDLALGSGFRWFGIVVVRGRLTLEPDGPADGGIWGTVLVGDSTVLRVPLAARRVSVHYSKCPIVKALEAIAPVRMMRSRGWSELF